jgi:8-oxo-dGTP pyrophosphatase MutT (NUDIX family)
MSPAGMQFAALPYRVGENGSLQVMLIRSRDTRRWIIPKGWPMKGLHPSRVAEREAYEEAGLVGRIGKEAVGSYRYDKRSPTSSQRCQVWVFLFRVEQQVDDWPERAQRETKWFGRDDAAEQVHETDLREIIGRASFFLRDGP